MEPVSITALKVSTCLKFIRQWYARPCAHISKMHAHGQTCHLTGMTRGFDTRLVQRTEIMESKVSRRLKEPLAQEICEHIYGPRLARDFTRQFAYLTDVNQAHLLM